MKKRCSKCGVLKSRSEFFANKRKKDGLRSDCKACFSAVAHKHDAENRERINAQQRAARAADPERYRAYHAKYAAENPEKYKARRARYYAENRERAIEAATQWARDNPERNREKHARWREKNKERWAQLMREAGTRYRERHPEALLEIQTQRKRVKRRRLPWAERDKMRIVYKKAREWGMEVDHIVPIRHPLVSGLHVWANLQLLARTANRAKKNIAWPDMPG